jgi:hypothetical protein
MADTRFEKLCVSNFSPPETTREIEDYRVELSEVMGSLSPRVPRQQTHPFFLLLPLPLPYADSIPGAARHSLGLHSPNRRHDNDQLLLRYRRVSL